MNLCMKISVVSDAEAMYLCSVCIELPVQGRLYLRNRPRDMVAGLLLCLPDNSNLLRMGRLYLGSHNSNPLDRCNIQLLLCDSCTCRFHTV